MEYIFITAFGVGGATVLGSLLGFIIKNPTQKFNDAVLSFAGGVMLAASIIGLILPAIGYDGKLSLLLAVVGIFCGAICLSLIDKIVPHLHKLSGADQEHDEKQASRINRVLLFVTAIAIHNLPEGMSAGVGFASQNLSHAFSVAIGIALQNVPEGMIIIAPMITSGISQKRAFLIALATGLVEVVGTFIGYFFAALTSSFLPFILAFAGGTMLYVISDEMIPETHSHGNERLATYAFLVGVTVMLIFDFLLG